MHLRCSFLLLTLFHAGKCTAAPAPLPSEITSAAELISGIESGLLVPLITATNDDGDLPSVLIKERIDMLPRTIRRPQTFSITASQRVIRTTTHHKAWMNSGLYQGDIAGVSSELMSRAADGTLQLNAIKGSRFRWSNAVIPYELSRNFNYRERSAISRAMETYRTKTCLRFVPRTNEYDYLNIIKGYGCYSQVGKSGGRQELSLGNGCVYHEIIVHELMHALGFWHEHSRADRDQYIRIIWNNVVPGMRGQFDKISFAYQDFLGESYDYYSVMHYDNQAFTIRRGLNTIEAVKPGFTNIIGNAKDLSATDLRKLNKLYDCPTVIQPTTRPVVTTTKTPRTTTTTTRRWTRRTTATTHRPTTAKPRPLPPVKPSQACVDKFLDCPYFYHYCYKTNFRSVMRQYCPRTCGYCQEAEFVARSPTSSNRNSYRNWNG